LKITALEDHEEPPLMPDGFDMSSLLKQAQQMQEQMEEAQRELGDQRVTGTSGGGLVKATVNGLQELVGLEIAPSAADPEDTETLADLIVAAVRDANQAAERLQQNKLGPLGSAFGGLGPGGGIPGF
jgi:nucleoid-associated protein EbfC